ncbi:MAG: protein kinase [Deltaproteobacteria bacterium]|nr:protein kinase [Deltaproteobacteria bacterium]
MLAPLDLVADRFEIEAEVGVGGMGRIYRARDRRSGCTVALKVLHDNDDPHRFEREVRALAELDHPAVVRYVGHGTTEAGRLFLAMEWLEGEDLSARLGRGCLDVAETITLGSTIAGALGAAHARGIVHRDIKPPNLFLAGGRVDDARIVDFGIARGPWSGRQVTMTGAVVGTPAYMSPEQARGERQIGPEADIFSLGCVLFECLTGRQAFTGEQAMAILVKVLLEDPPHVAELRPDVPRELDELVARMLSKSPAARPGDGSDLFAGLAQIRPSAAPPAPPRPAPAAAITPREQRLISVVLARYEGAQEDAAATVRLGRASSDADPLAGVRRLVAAHGGRLDSLADGSLVASLFGTGTATDQAAAAARMALALTRLLFDWRLALATGRGDVSGRLPVGDAVERAAELLSTPSPEGTFRIDALTAGLLGSQFDVGADDRGLVLWGERERATEHSARTLLGKPTPCVGREREIAALASTFEECVSEPVARAVILSGVAGTGKSRLRWEFARGLKGRADVIVARGDSVRAGAPLLIVAGLVRRASGVRDGEPLAVRRARVSARVGRHVPAAEVGRVSEFLAELIAAPSDEELGPALVAARRDPILMGDHMRRAFEDWLDAETAAHPLVLVLEDVQWADRPSIEIIDGALRLLEDRPLLVLAVGRPELHERFPALWTERDAQQLRLGALTRSAGERLVRSALGDTVTEDRARQISQKAAGNAFFLEELIRAEAAGAGESTPQTVLATLQTRLEALPAEGRRVLRAASVFGRIFWRGGVRALLGGPGSRDELDTHLDELALREVISRRADARFAGEDEYSFRHDLVREAAYAMVAEADRAPAHRLAAGWLEQAGETDASLLAEHFERGGLPERAWSGILDAARHALEGNDFAAVLAWVERLSRSGASGVLLGRARLIEAEACRWLGKNAEALLAARAAGELLDPVCSEWMDAAGEVARAAARVGDAEILSTATAGVLARWPSLRPDGRTLVGVANVALALTTVGRYREADELLELVVDVEPDLLRSDPAAFARLADARAYRRLVAGEIEEYLAASESAFAHYEAAGDLRNGANERVSSGFALLVLGQHERAIERLRGAVAAGHRMGLPFVVASANNNLGLALGLSGALDEGLAVEREAVESFRAQGDRRFEAGSRIYVAWMLLLKGDAAPARDEACAAVAASEGVPPTRAHALAILARAALESGDSRAALEHMRESREIYDSLGGLEEGEAFIELVEAEVLWQAGERDRARAAIATAHVKLIERAQKIADPALRESFLGRVPENARIAELVAAWR